MLNLVRQQESSIPVMEMKDGDIAVIVNWSTDSYKYVDRIVQRHESTLLTVGANYGKAWGPVFSDGRESLPDTCRVRILEKGETLEVN